MSVSGHWFECGSRFAGKYFSWVISNKKNTSHRLNRYFSKEYCEVLQFSGLDVKPRDILCFAYVSALISFLVFLLFDILVLFVYGFRLGDVDVGTILLMGIASVAVPLVVMNLVANYPKTYAHYMKIHSLGDVPEILSYLVMYLKLVPNLENSVKFAAQQSSTSLSCDLRKMLWDMEIRVYHGIDDALTDFASRWGKWCDYFKRSLHLIRSSIQERDEASRTITLNRALDVSLEGTRDMMNQFASKLQQPTMVIYSIGIMIPLALVAMLPATGLVGVKITIFQVFFLYNVFLPLVIFLYMRKILLSRPATFSPPVIPFDHPKLLGIHKRRRLLFAVLVGFFVALPGVVFLFLPTQYSFFGWFGFLFDENGFVPVTLFIIWGIAVGLSLYCLSVYAPYIKIRGEIKQMENEFSDALYILGKRIAEEKSPEEGFLYAATTMGDAKIAGVFQQTGYNLTAMHTDLRDALFSSEFGSLRYVYSDRIKAIMRLFVEGISRSQRAVSISLVKIADHLKELQEVEHKIKDNLYELTSTLRSTVALFAPLIAGVTLAITKLISTILSSMSGAIPTDAVADMPSVLSQVADSFAIENVRPEYFVLVVGIYILELVVLLTRFTNGIDEGDDTAAFMYSLGKVMPVTVVVLTSTVIVANYMFSSIAHSIG
ncbi:MAG: hypothetical protein NT038_05805 [Euryarchaeota archaeon]|nr:hypothetical protein [Euryarchaeota archaeon]